MSELMLAHATATHQGGDRFPRAKVKTDKEGLTVITTMAKGAYKSVFYTTLEVEALIEALKASAMDTEKVFSVEWGADR